MRYTQAKPLIDKLMDIAVLFHGSPSLLRDRLYSAINEFLPDMDEACMERGCPAFDGRDVVEEAPPIQEQTEKQTIDKDTMEYLTMAQEADVSIRGHYDETGVTPQELERFAALVAAAEREACAKVCEEVERKATKQPPMVGQGAQSCAAAIRARGEK
jgi:hypothetical protein